MTTPPSAVPRVPYPARRVGVVRPARNGIKPGRLNAVKPPEDNEQLPELTDAWFDEMIQQVDAATARLHRARAAVSR